MEKSSKDTKTVSVSCELWTKRAPEEGRRRSKEHFRSALTIAGNMLAIASHLLGLKDRFPDLNTYPTCRHLLNLLGFVHEGLARWGVQSDQAPGQEEDQAELAERLERLKQSLLGVDSKLELGRDSWDVPSVSAIWLLIELVYKKEETTPTTIEECESLLLGRLQFKLKQERNSGTGVPAVIFICIHRRRGGIILGEGKTRWWPFTAVHTKFAEMRLERLQENGLKGLAEKCEILRQKWIEINRDFSEFCQVPEVKSFRQFNHRADPGRAYRVYSRDPKKSFEQRAPCKKCFHLYHWGYEAKADPASDVHDAGNCAEDDVHLRLRKGDQVLLNKAEDQTSY